MSAPKPRVSDERLAVLLTYANRPPKFGNTWPDWQIGEVAEDLRDARAELARLRPVAEAAQEWGLARQALSDCSRIDAVREATDAAVRVMMAERALVAALDALRAGEKEGG